jgi:hypothetical protein
MEKGDLDASRLRATAGQRTYLFSLDAYPCEPYNTPGVHSYSR